MFVSGEVFKVIIRRSRFASICLMTLASAISITEYATYKPVVVPDEVDGEISSSDDENAEISENVTENNADESDEITEVEPQVETTKVDPFTPAGDKEITISSGDTFASVITNLGFDKTDVYLASKSLSRVFNLRNLKVGQKLVIKGKRDKSGDLILTGIEFRPDYKSKVVVSKNNSGYSAEKVDVPVKKIIRSVSGKIDPKAPAYSLKKCGVKASVSAEALKGLSQIVNIKSSKTPVDFEFLYQNYYDDEGHVARKPELLYASVFVNGKIRRIYKFSYGNTNEFVDANGTILHTLAKSGSLLSNPLGVMKVTSHFGLRRHPISGRVKRHDGIDLKAHAGTPIRAPADGIVTEAKYYSGYGRYIKIRHTETISTAYGHLSKIVVRKGQRVTKGQVIGYTGNSGNSTGYHLHYEVQKNGRPINPMHFSEKDKSKKLTGEKLARFKEFKKNIHIQVVGIVPSKGKSLKVKKYS